jgi:hypothetical protein
MERHGKSAEMDEHYALIEREAKLWRTICDDIAQPSNMPAKRPMKDHPLWPQYEDVNKLVDEAMAALRLIDPRAELEAQRVRLNRKLGNY